MNLLANITRSEGDPKIRRSGPGSLSAVDRLGWALGWFSLGLGAVELFAPRRITRALGIEGKEGLVRAYGVREIGGGVLSLSVDKGFGLWGRVAGDGLDIATLVAALHPGNRKRDNVRLALAVVVGITLIDVVSALGVTTRHARRRGTVRDYSDRSGFPQGVEKARAAARASGVPKSA